MQRDIVCYYADLGRPYLPLLERMTRSARQTMPDCHLILMTPTPSEELRRLFDTTLGLPAPTSVATLCLERARATVSWATQTPNETIFADPDIVFRRRPTFGDFDIGLAWRKKADQPVNTGVVIARPGCTRFWLRYAAAVVNLPAELHGWWCDQLGFSLMTGIVHEAGDILNIVDARVGLLPAALMCPKAGDETEESWTVHYKGPLKGPEWSGIFRGKESSRAAGTSPQASA